MDGWMDHHIIVSCRFTTSSQGKGSWLLGWSDHPRHDRQAPGQDRKTMRFGPGESIIISRIFFLSLSSACQLCLYAACYRRVPRRTANATSLEARNPTQDPQPPNKARERRPSVPPVGTDRLLSRRADRKHNNRVSPVGVNLTVRSNVRPLFRHECISGGICRHHVRSVGA